jgi:hypothetical protein
VLHIALQSRNKLQISLDRCIILSMRNRLRKLELPVAQAKSPKITSLQRRYSVTPQAATDKIVVKKIIMETK